jgi:hypothetical protein
MAGPKITIFPSMMLKGELVAALESEPEFTEYWYKLAKEASGRARLGSLPSWHVPASYTPGARYLPPTEALPDDPAEGAGATAAATPVVPPGQESGGAIAAALCLHCHLRAMTSRRTRPGTGPRLRAGPFI